MKDEIKKLEKRLKLEYALFWALMVAVVVLYETGVWTEGALAGDGKMEYMMQMAGIILVIAFIPLSLKMFSFAMNHGVKEAPLNEALKKYARWSEIRLMMLLAVVIFNLTVYYSIMDTAGLLCAGMGMIAALFCVPNAKNIVAELDLDMKEEI